MVSIKPVFRTLGMCNDHLVAQYQSLAWQHAFQVALYSFLMHMHARANV